MSTLKTTNIICNNYADTTNDTKKMTTSFTAATINTATTIQFIQTANRTITIPNATDTLIGKNTTDTLTNKTLTATTNIIRATQLATNTADVIISAAAPPSVGQILTATSTTAATWQDPVSNPIITNFSTYLESTTSTSSNSMALMKGLSLTPTSEGVYYISFDAIFTISTTADCSWAIYVDGIQNVSSLRVIDGRYITAYTQCIIDYTKGNIEIYWSTSKGTLTSNKGSLIAIKLS